MEYAQEFSKREKWTRVCLYSLVGLLLIICQRKWFNPLITDFASRPHCYEFAGLNGADYVWELILVGIPILALIPMLVALVPLAIKGLVQGRFPPEGMKVYTPTVVARGPKAYVKPALFLGLTAGCVILIFWGHHQAANMPALDKAKLDPAQCQSNSASLQTGSGEG